MDKKQHAPKHTPEKKKQNKKKQQQSPSHKKPTPPAHQKSSVPKPPRRPQLAHAKKFSRSKERDERAKQRQIMAKKHKQRLLDAKVARQRQRNRQMRRLRRKVESKQKKAKRKTGHAELTSAEDAVLRDQQIKEDSCYNRFRMLLDDALAGLKHFLTVTLRSERTSDWLMFLLNNLGLFQEYEINDYGQRLSPRTGRPVLLSLGPFRVVQLVESANQVRSHWDPYIREYLRNSKLTTDCWRANRMALQVAMCMDETGQMFDMPIENSAFSKKKGSPVS